MDAERVAAAGAVAPDGPNAPDAGLWAKSEPFHPLRCHLVDVAAVARELIDYFGPVHGLDAECAAVLAGLHDLGKADARFQKKDAQLARGIVLCAEPIHEQEIRGFRHEARTAELVRAILLAQGWKRPLARTVARALGSHHGRADQHVDRETPDCRERWRAAREALIASLAAGGRLQAPLATPDHFDRTGVQLLGLTVTADWIASNDTLYLRPPSDLPEVEYRSAAQAAARHAVAAVGLQRPGDERGPLDWEARWPGRKPRGIQRAAVALSENVSEASLVIIEAPMGQGKTEAALHLASTFMQRLGKVGFFVALPTQATSNQMHGRVQEYLERRYPGAKPLLVHGMSWLLDDRAIEHAARAEVDAGEPGSEERQAAEAWLRNSRRALLAPFAVGTVDQLLLAALAVKFGVLRVFGLANKVVIVDEVHACDPFMMRRLEMALAWLRVLEVPVILLSATLARHQREALIRSYTGDEDATLPAEDAYPLVTVAGKTTIETSKPSEPEVGRIVGIELLRGSLDDEQVLQHLAEEALDAIAEGGCAVLIVNTVRAAQALFRAVRLALDASGQAESIWSGLFHSRYPAWRRMQIEAEVLERFGPGTRRRPARGILVATQVVEQSLDVDFDVMISEIAPIDLLLQRSGRLWRHPRGERHGAGPVLQVLVPNPGVWGFGPSERVYAPLHLLRTLAILAGRSEIRIPAEMRLLVEAVHGDHAIDAGLVPPDLLEAARARYESALMADRDHARNHIIGCPDPAQFRYPGERVPLRDEVDEEAGTNALFARTRLDRLPTQAILALTRDEDLAAFEALSSRAAAAGRATLRRVLSTRLSVPAYMLRGVPTRGEPIRGSVAVDLRTGAAGPLRYDDALGLQLRKADGGHPPAAS